MDKAAFRASFPEFTVPSFPDPIVNFWSVLAETLVDSDAWGNLHDQGIFLLTAHYLSMAKMSSGSVSSGDTGQITQQKVGDVSVSYDSMAGSVTNAGAYNRTLYGKQYYELVNLVGAGAIQL